MDCATDGYVTITAYGELIKDLDPDEFVHVTLIVVTIFLPLKLKPIMIEILYWL